MATQESKLVITIDSRHALRDAQAMRRELESLDKTGQFATKSMDQMSVAMRQLAGYTAGLITVSAAINKMDVYTGMQNRLKLVTESQEQLNQAMGDTFGIAQKSYQSWDSVIQVYQRFSDNAKTLRIDMAKTAELTETVSKAVAISGASTQAAEAALTQFGQALASGVLRGEELNSILEQTPALAKAIAQGMGITVGQLRSVAAEGKITGEVLVDALTKSKGSVDELFAKTDVTIGQSLTLLNNEITKFVGGAGQASGAASLMAGSIKVLGENLGTVANIAVLGGIAALTKAIASKTIAMQGSISVALAQSAADLKQKQDALALATAKVNEAKAHLANVQATNAETQAKYGATAANARYKLASDAVTRSVAAQAAAQNALNTSTTIGSKALGLVGGPIGAITLGITALAAGYMYLQNRTAEANEKLVEQGKVAEKTKEELLALKGVQLDVAKDDLAASFEAQNEALRKADIAFNGFIRTIANGNKQSTEAKEIYDQVRQGLVSQEDAIERLNKLNLLTPEQKAQGLDLINSYEDARDKAQKNADAQKILGKEVVLAGNASQNSAGQHRTQANALNDVEGAARGAANALSEYAQQAMSAGRKAEITNTIIAKGYSQGVASDLAEIAEKNGKVTQAEAKAILYKHKQLEKLNATLEAQRKAEQAKVKAASAQSKAALTQQKKDEKAAEQLLKEQYDLRESIYYKDADRIMKIEKDLENEITDIQKARFSPKDTAGYIENAKNRADLEKKLYVAQLTEEVSSWRLSEERKLELRKNVNDLAIQLNGDMNDDFKKQALQSSEDQYQHELALIKLSQETRLFQLREYLMSETAAMQERYRLEREQILLNSKLSEEQKKREIALSKALQEEENRRRLNNAVQAWGSIQAEMNGTGDQYRLEQERFSRYDASQDVFDAQMSQVDQAAQDPNANMQEIAAQREAIWQAHHDRMTAIESDYYSNSQALQIAGMGQIASGLTSIVGDMAGEQSLAYKAMFAVEKGFAIAQSALAIQTGVSKAMALGFPQNIPVIAQTVMEGAKIASAIKSITDTGFANGGYTGHGGKYDPAGIVHKGEGVLTQEEIKALGGPQGFEDLRKSIRRGYSAGGLVADTHRVGMGAVSAINSGVANSSSSSGDVNISQSITFADGGAKVDTQGQKEIAQSLNNMMDAWARRESRQGGVLHKLARG